MSAPDQQVEVSRFLDFSRAQWAKLRASTPLPLSEAQLKGLVGVNERMLLGEVEDIYLPLSRLLTLYVGATENLHRTIASFLGSSAPRVPFVIGLAGSVAVGKSTTSRILLGIPVFYGWRAAQAGQVSRPPQLLPMAPQYVAVALERMAAMGLSPRRAA